MVNLGFYNFFKNGRVTYSRISLERLDYNTYICLIKGIKLVLKKLVKSFLLLHYMLEFVKSCCLLIFDLVIFYKKTFYPLELNLDDNGTGLETVRGDVSFKYKMKYWVTPPNHMMNNRN